MFLVPKSTCIGFDRDRNYGALRHDFAMKV